MVLGAEGRGINQRLQAIHKRGMPYVDKHSPAFFRRLQFLRAANRLTAEGLDGLPVRIILPPCC